jgi:hypothetical protein
VIESSAGFGFSQARIPVWQVRCSMENRAAAKTQNSRTGEIPMAVQKKSLIGNRAAAKKAIIATNVASTKLETAKVRPGAAPLTTLKEVGRGHQFVGAKNNPMVGQGLRAFSAKHAKVGAQMIGGKKK